MNMGLAGYYTIHKQKVLTDENGQIVLNEHGEQILIGQAEKITQFQNLITDVGLNAFARGDSVTNYCLVSSENNAPNKSDSSIVAIGVSNQSSSHKFTRQIETEPYYMSYSMTYRFNAGVATGNINKVAISAKNTGSDIFSVSLIKDMEDRTTTITKLADEILDITYELRLYINTQDYTGTVNISGREHDVIVRPANLQSWSSIFGNIRYAYAYNSDIGNVKGQPSGQNLTVSNSVSQQDYIEQSLTKSFIISANTDSANFSNGIRSIYLRGWNDSQFFQIQFDPPIMKTNKQTLTLPVFNMIYGRYGDDS